MNYQIERLLENEKIKCHEVRATMYSGHHLLLHFFITQPDIVDSLPQFKIGYEVYGVSAKDLVSDNNKPLEPLIKEYGLLDSSDTIHSIFNFGNTTAKNEWTGEQADLLTHHDTQSVLSPNTADNVSMNKNLRHVSEMVDNSIYAGEDIISTPNYLKERDSTLITVDPIVVTEDNKKQHSIWTSDIHFNKYQHCSNEEMLELFKKYKGYIDMNIPANLDTESRLNIEMEDLFGTSFDVIRLQNKFLNDQVTENHF